MRKYRVSRFKQLIFPQELIIDKFHVLSRKRHFPMFWKVTEESIPLSKLASIQLQRGLLFSKIIIENAGGPYPIIVDGLWNRTAHEARDLLEMIEREMQDRGEVEELVGGEETPPSGPQRGGHGPEPSDLNIPPSQPPSSETETEPARVASTYQPGSTEDREHLERIAKDIVEDKPDTRASHNDSPMAAHFQALRDMKASIEPPSAPPSSPAPAAQQVDSEIPGSKRIGNIPDGWNPPPPWAPKKSEPKVELPGYREIDPAEFLNNTSETRTAVEEKPRRSTRKSSVGKLVNWWKEAKGDLSDRANSRRRRRQLK
jgi:hypothetical protein